MAAIRIGKTLVDGLMLIPTLTHWGYMLSLLRSWYLSFRFDGVAIPISEWWNFKKRKRLSNANYKRRLLFRVAFYWFSAIAVMKNGCSVPEVRNPVACLRSIFAS